MINQYPSSHNRYRIAGFTLVELLVVVTVMVILAGMFTVALSGTRRDAEEKRAVAELLGYSQTLQQVVNETMLTPVAFVTELNTDAAGTELNRVTSLARREILRMKFPQCRADLIYPPAQLVYRLAPLTSGATAANKPVAPEEWFQMRSLAGFASPQLTSMVPVARQLFVDPSMDTVALYADTSGSGPGIRNALGQMTVGGTAGDVIDLVAAPWPAVPATVEVWTREHESAECLYLILSTTYIFGERAIDQVHQRNIGNLDGDTVPEILDSWGTPVEFLRTPVGRDYVLDDFVNYDQTNSAGTDALDYLRTDPKFSNIRKTDDPFRLSPLIVSAGPDEEFGMRRTFDIDGNLADDTRGMSPRASQAIVRFNAPTVGVISYPDPYVQFTGASPGPFLSGIDKAVNQYIIQPSGLTSSAAVAWVGDTATNGSVVPVGLGAPFFDDDRRPVEEFADNITSESIK